MSVSHGNLSGDQVITMFQQMMEQMREMEERIINNMATKKDVDKIEENIELRIGALEGKVADLPIREDFEDLQKRIGNMEAGAFSKDDLELLKAKDEKDLEDLQNQVLEKVETRLAEKSLKPEVDPEEIADRVEVKLAERFFTKEECEKREEETAKSFESKQKEFSEKTDKKYTELYLQLRTMAVDTQKARLQEPSVSFNDSNGTDIFGGSGPMAPLSILKDPDKKADLSASPALFSKAGGARGFDSQTPILNVSKKDPDKGFGDIDRG